MNPQRYTAQQPQCNADQGRQRSAEQAPRPAAPADARRTAEEAARCVMHPESYDPEWRYYHGAWGG